MSFTTSTSAADRIVSYLEMWDVEGCGGGGGGVVAVEFESFFVC